MNRLDLQIHFYNVFKIKWGNCNVLLHFVEIRKHEIYISTARGEEEERGRERIKRTCHVGMCAGVYLYVNGGE